MAKNVYVVEVIDNGVINAFEKLADAQTWAWDTYMGELDMIYGGCDLSAGQIISTIKEDYNTLMEKSYITDYLWITEAPLIKVGEIDD